MPTTAPLHPTVRFPLDLPRRRPGLLVSVRDASEAVDALEGGADVIDVKEPRRGPLGRADRQTVEAVARAVHGLAPVTVALGELREVDDFEPLGRHIDAAKVGLSGVTEVDWRADLARLREQSAGVPIVPVGYAEEAGVGAPRLEAVLKTAETAGWMVIDTFDKAGPSTLDRLGPDRVAELLRRAQRIGVRVVLAGGLRGDQIAAAARLRPAIIGVRGAACEEGRDGVVDPGRVKSIAQALAGVRSDSQHFPPRPTRSDSCPTST